MLARPSAPGAKSQKSVAATTSTLELPLDACGSTLSAAVLGQPGLIAPPNSFQGKSFDTWKGPVHGAPARQGAGQQNKESNCESFSFHYLQSKGSTNNSYSRVLIGCSIKK